MNGTNTENTVSQEALDIAKKQATLSYRIKRNKACYMMLAPYFILFFFLYRFTGCDECGFQFYLL